MTNPGQEDFIRKNLRNLITSKDEYFPYFCDGKCLCGTCTCGRCRCVHLKYRTNRDTPVPKSSYQQDYLQWQMPEFKRGKNLNENAKFSFPIETQTMNRLDYRPFKGKEFMQERLFPNQANQNNIEPFLRKLRAPATKETTYKFDYPNWEVNKVC